MSTATVNLAKESSKRKVKKPTWYLAVKTFPAALPAYEILEDVSYKSREEAFQAAKKQPEVLEKNEVHIISVSDRLVVKRRETIKVTI